jgi:hypothetical protein
MPYKNDLTAAHGRIASLEQQLEDKPEPPKEEDVKCDECGEVDWNTAAPLTIFLGVVLAVLGMITAAFWSHGDLGDCYIESYYVTVEKGEPRVQRFQLSRAVDWGEDSRVGVWTTLEEAKKGAEIVQCPLNYGD